MCVSVGVGVGVGVGVSRGVGVGEGVSEGVSIGLQGIRVQVARSLPDQRRAIGSGAVPTTDATDA